MLRQLQQNVESSTYPRTGKRGVPQQFPRRLYELLESESSKIMKQNEVIIEWSSSGRAFRIDNASKFASIILPKYFRTSKFSSFQRNLNLYGFFKVRRGPDTDMYAHPAFIRGKPELLIQLRKSASSPDKKNIKVSCSLFPSQTSSPQFSSPSMDSSTRRAVSPSPPKKIDNTALLKPKNIVFTRNAPFPNLMTSSTTPITNSCCQEQQLLPSSAQQTSGFSDGNKLALLAVVLSSLADTDSKNVY